MAVACFSRHGRSHIVDSGASHHLISRQVLTLKQQKTVREAMYVIAIQTAEKDVVCHWEADVWVKDLQIFVVAFVLDTDVPPLLSAGKLNKAGFAFHQITDDNFYLENKSIGVIQT